MSDNPAQIKKFFLEVNSVLSVRADFLNNPIETLHLYGIFLGDEAEQEIAAMIEVIKQTVPNVANLPSNFGPLYVNVAALPKAKRLIDPPNDGTWIL